MAIEIEPLKEKFKIIFGSEAEFFVRAPGRVNLIGEHIDYNGYGVLPMALEQDVQIVCRSNPDSSKIRLRNLDTKYQDYEGESLNFQIDRSKPQWFHYFLCGYRGMLEKLQLDKGPIKGMDVLLSGSIPPSAGLSSSSALVCCAAITTLRAQAGQDFDKISKDEIAELCAQCERYIGTQGGGMDQAISMLAQSGMAKKIDFNPLRTENVQLPPGAAFVVCHSSAEMNKAASSYFNERVVECRLASQLLAKAKGLDWKNIKKLGQLQEQLENATLKQMMDSVQEVVKPTPYTKTEICFLLKTTEEELNELSFSENTKHMTEFSLYDRAMHVYGEADRVTQFAKLCASGEPSLEKLGNLMNQSHASCSRRYKCSCKELDELVKACK